MKISELSGIYEETERARELAVSKNGRKMFGPPEANHEFEGIGFAGRLSNVAHKSMRLGMAAG
jgi:hypothetical protein